MAPGLVGAHQVEDAAGAEEEGAHTHAHDGQHPGHASFQAPSVRLSRPRRCPTRPPPVAPRLARNEGCNGRSPAREGVRRRALDSELGAKALGPGNVMIELSSKNDVLAALSSATQSSSPARLLAEAATIAARIAGLETFCCSL